MVAPPVAWGDSAGERDMGEHLTEVRKLGPAWSQFEAYWAQPAPSKVPAPALVIIHTIRGLTEHERALARAFADLGFVCVVPDLYSHQRMQVPVEDAREVERLLREVTFDGSFVPGFEQAIASRTRQDQERLHNAARIGVYAPDPNALADLKVCVAALHATPGVDHDRIACLGLSMGGGYAWTLATVEPRVRATVVFYGRPLLPYDQLAKLSGPVLAVHAGEDTRLTDLLPEVEQEMSYRGRSFTHITYPGVHHGFLNPEALTYHRGCARDAIFQVLTFLKESEGKLPAPADKSLKDRVLPEDAAPAPRPAPPEEKVTEEAAIEPNPEEAAPPEAEAAIEEAPTEAGQEATPEGEQEEAPPAEGETFEAVTEEEPPQGEVEETPADTALAAEPDEPSEETAPAEGAPGEEAPEEEAPQEGTPEEGPSEAGAPTEEAPGSEPLNESASPISNPEEAQAEPEAEGSDGEAPVEESAVAPETEEVPPTTQEHEEEASAPGPEAPVRAASPPERPGKAVVPRGAPVPEAPRVVPSTAKPAPGKSKAEVSAADVELLIKGHIPVADSRLPAPPIKEARSKPAMDTRKGRVPERRPAPPPPAKATPPTPKRPPERHMPSKPPEKSGKGKGAPTARPSPPPRKVVPVRAVPKVKPKAAPPPSKGRRDPRTLPRSKPKTPERPRKPSRKAK